MGASICKSEIKLSFLRHFAVGVIRSLLCVDWESEAQPCRSGTVWLVSHPFSTLMKMIQWKLLVVVVCGGRGAIWGYAKPKIKMTAVTRLDNKQIYSTDASCKLNNPWCRIYHCVIAHSVICVCVFAYVGVCAWVCAICSPVDKIMETQCQTRQLIAGWNKHLVLRLSKAEVSHCTCMSTRMSEWRHGKQCLWSKQYVEMFFFMFDCLLKGRIQQFYICFLLSGEYTCYMNAFKCPLPLLKLQYPCLQLWCFSRWRHLEFLSLYDAIWSCGVWEAK